MVKDAIKFFLETPICGLPPAEQFVGSGVYALYYTGSHELYVKIASVNRKRPTAPIYVGKAVPPGWRTARTTISESPDLFRRLNEHSRSLEQAKDLVQSDFCCRFMILADIESDLVVPVEAELIRELRPLWNTIVDGFGNHDPGAGRYNQAPSEWDTLHPGRTWAQRLTGNPPQLDAIIARVQQFCSDLSLS